MKANLNNNGVEILIVEDSPTQAAQLAHLLEQRGFTVMIAANGREALALLEQGYKPTLVITDIVMPELDGYGLCKAIKSNKKLKDIPVMLVTMLSDPQDVIRGLECGADNFLRKPYDERYLLSRIDYLLMNLDLRKNQKMQMGMEINLGGQKHFISAERQQILDLLISTYEQAVEINSELKQREQELAHSNHVLNALYRIAEGLNQAGSEQVVAETVLERALELPGIQAGWVSLREGESGFRLAAARNLPPALQAPGAMEGDCTCRRRLISGELDSVTNILECERMGKSGGDMCGLRYHASVPLWLGDRTLGVMNLVGPEKGLFNEDELKVLYNVGNQVAVALERAHLHEHLERLVEERTAALHASEARLRTIIEAEPECVKIVDAEGRVVQMNAAGLAMLEADSLEQVLGGKIAEFVVLAQREAYRTFEASVLDGNSAVFEFEIAGLKGAHLWLDTHAVPLPEPRGGRPQMLAITRDVTERRRAEDALLDSRESLSRLLNSMAEGAYGVDTSGNCTFVNRAFLQMLGYQNDNEVLGKHIHELMHHSHADGSPYPASECRMYRVYQSHQQINVSDEVFWRKDGVAIPVEYWSYPIVADGVVTGAIATFIDITERKENEAKIQRLNRIYSVLSGINTMIVRTRDRRVLFEDVCRIAVEQGKFRLAWIGLLDANGLDVTPMARAGVDEGYLDNIHLTIRNESPDHCEMVMRAVREKTVVVCNDIDTDPQMARWREEALRRGYGSVVVFPLQLEDKVMGLLLLYASEAGFFDMEEMRLLTEIAGDISFALDHLEKEDRLNYLAYYDALTGLPNRSLLRDRLDQRVNAARSEEKALAVIMLNVERFRSVNDTLGQHAGDELLRQVARRLQDGLDESDILARLGADSFAIVTQRCDDDGGVGHILERVLSCIHGQPFEIEGQELRVAAKAGVAMFPHDGEDVDTLSRNAEAALGKAKRSGDKYLFYAPEFNARVAEKLTLENKLRRAVDRGELVLHHQPKVDLKQRRIVGLEALMRWNDPDTGLAVPPVKFIPILEETGLILEAGRWALEQAIADSARWKSKRLQVPRIAVNVSAIQLRQKDFVATVERALRDAEDMEDILELEITESLIMQDIDANIRKLQAIRDMGVEIAVDDFGTGYSSLSYISRLPINTLKIDRAFVMNMTSKPDDLSIVSTIISLGHSLELKVVAEGVETEEQANLLRLLKCDEFQGYLFSPPVPVADMDLLLGEGKTSIT